jgi:hypothetical protein
LTSEGISVLNTKRPIKFKLDAFRFYLAGNNPTTSFQLASEANDNVALSGCMTNRGYASSYMSDDIGNYLRRRIQAGDLEVLAYFAEWGMNTKF